MYRRTILTAVRAMEHPLRIHISCEISFSLAGIHFMYDMHGISIILYESFFGNKRDLLVSKPLYMRDTCIAQ